MLAVVYRSLDNGITVIIHVAYYFSSTFLVVFAFIHLH